MTWFIAWYIVGFAVFWWLLTLSDDQIDLHDLLMCFVSGFLGPINFIFLPYAMSRSNWGRTVIWRRKK